LVRVTPAHACACSSAAGLGHVDEAKPPLEFLAAMIQLMTEA
jgi:hypothetical protein